MIANEPTTRPTLRDVARQAYLERLAEFERVEQERLASLAAYHAAEARYLVERARRMLGLDWLDPNDDTLCGADDTQAPILNVDGHLFRLRGADLQLGLARDDWRTVRDAAHVYELIENQP